LIRKAPKTWKEFRRRRESESSGQVRHHRLAVLGACRKFPHGTTCRSHPENGIAGMDTEFKVNSPLHVRHPMLADFAKRGCSYAGRRNGRSPSPASARW
jgi:hypothetical protein